MKIIKYSLIALAIIGILLVLFINGNLASLAEWFYPGAAVWTHIALAVIELIALLWFWRGLFGRHEHLLIMGKDDTPEERERFIAEFAKRMRNNPYIAEADISPNSPEYIDECLSVLKQKADEEIQKNARRIFLATALTQNGRLDALIVFVSLCRLVWRVSSIYNQRPHPREIISLYWAVVSTTFLAFTIEELDLTTEISIGFGESFHAMVPAGMTASIPFAGKVLQTFTSSAVDGTANCYLALRAGIITRNAFSYRATGEKVPGRAEVFREAGAVLIGMSKELLDKLAGALAKNFMGVARTAQDKTVQAGMTIVDSIGRVGEGIGSSAGKMASGAAGAAQSAGNSLLKAGAATGSGVIKVGTATGSAMGKMVKNTAVGAARVVSAPFKLSGKILLKNKRKNNKNSINK